ncbi:hypothetical protein BJF78_14885 [Pseudonocardia sp. CNS-139]|nr:hypothetical protein BJF78_14885 [Pseudonocardia sp. CNS-139]
MTGGCCAWATAGQKPIAGAPQPADHYVPTGELGEYPEIMRRCFSRFHAHPVRVNAYFEGYVGGARPIIRTVGAITVGVGFSGKAFKFAPAYGELVADLAARGEARPEGRFVVGEAVTEPA